MTRGLKVAVRRVLPEPVLLPLVALYRMARRSELTALARFVAARGVGVGAAERLSLALRCVWISLRVDCPHAQAEILAFVAHVLALPRSVDGCVVEAGAYKGGSTAKFSLACAAAGRRLVVFDSFRGLPENDEPHELNIFGRPASFAGGDYAGSLEEVRGNVARYGRAEVCEFRPGWFEETMPVFHEPVAAAYLDVDLASSTRTCLRHLYPLLTGGDVFSQDGHLPLVLGVIADRRFWRDEVGCEPPELCGVGERKLIRIRRASAPAAVPVGRR